MKTVEYERKVYKAMLEWKETLAPDYALFLKGARGVGKTTLAEKLGREAYKTYILVRFDQAGDDVKDLFVNSLRDLDNFYAVLQLLYRTYLHERESLIILDEIQLFPHARQAVKTLLEDGRYDILETGSLAAVTKRNRAILIPSEEYTQEVFPMDFEEFLWAQGDRMTVPLIRSHYEAMKPMKDLHRPIMQSFREYMMVGGMPQAVKKFVESRDYGKVDLVKQQIISLYCNDMEIQNAERPEHVSSFFFRIPAELSKRDKRFVISHINPNARIREYQGPIRWLDRAMIVNIASGVDDPGASLNMSLSAPSFKCYLMDTGLLITLAFKDRPILENELYKHILLDRLQVNEGMLIENLVAQCLRANGHRAYFYLERNPATRKKTLEADFLIRQNERTVPIWVDSSSRIKSLERFKEKFGKRIGDGIVLHQGDLKREGGVAYLPYYMACVL